ncbi:unnamed protein product [Pocillopora meandrina]|uniref:NACHT domain-containing protein n=1 Tax=Pocillopora meandrina TaxID=46732 RepID=A0AAU9XM98_9CNID|nr:unnamed protein product [Pocillopora meandrina]
MTFATPSNPSTKGTSNYAQLCRLLVEVGSHVFKEIFDRVCPPEKLHTVLTNPTNCAKLQTLRKKRVLSYWNDIKDTFQRIGGARYQDVINDLKTDCMDADIEKDYQELYREWLKDEDCVTDKSYEDEMVKKARKEDDLEGSIETYEQNLGKEGLWKVQNASPPELNVTLPLMSDLPETSFTWNDVELPVDILLLTAEDCEFLSCFAYLREPFKSYHISTGPVYFGCMGDDQGKKMKIALMRCCKGPGVPGGSLSVSKDAILLLRPKAIFSVGACSGLNSKKVKLGDVVVSAKLITAAHKTPPSRDIGKLIKHVADGWKAPLQNADEYNAKVHCDGVVLSILEANRDMIRKHPEAIAVEMEGGGVYAAAHDFKTEWVVVKGIKDFVDEMQSSSKKWKQIACVMAASVVANILNDPVIFQDWPHFNAGANELPSQAISTYTSALKSSIMYHTEFQPKLLASRTISNAKTDEIFTNLLIQHGRKALIRNDETYYSRSKELEYYGKISGTPVKHCSEILLGMIDDQESANSILVVGKAGIGKSLFCQKVIRDWANNKLLRALESTEIPNLKFVYLLTFRQLNLLKNKHLTLREILNFSSVLNDKCDINESTFEYIVKHSKEVMIILDGYDEYSQKTSIDGNSEGRHPNDVNRKMPVAALCSKLINGKILQGAIVMITSRPDESDKMGGIRYKRYVEIAGFSAEQVKEYIKKYFKKNENMKNAVLKHVMNNENLVSFAHIPMLCYLLCFEMEYTLTESENSDDLPVSITDIYTKLVDIFELKHCAESEYRQKEIPEKFKPPPVIKNTLEKLSKLAAKLLVERKPTFDESEMERDFELEEVNKLKGGGLLYCGQPFRTELITTTKHFSFTHLTVQEFLAARWFVREIVFPMRNALKWFTNSWLAFSHVTQTRK